jgi:hypothetical protein
MREGGAHTHTLTHARTHTPSHAKARRAAASAYTLAFGDADAR